MNVSPSYPKQTTLLLYYTYERRRTQNGHAREFASHTHERYGNGRYDHVNNIEFATQVPASAQSFTFCGSLACDTTKSAYALRGTMQTTSPEDGN